MNYHEPIERRNFERFPLKQGAMAALTPSHGMSYYTVLGQIVDISEGGLTHISQLNRFLENFALTSPAELPTAVGDPTP